MQNKAKSPICVPITVSTLAKLRTAIEIETKLTDFIEVRADAIEGLNLTMVDEIRKMIPVQSTCIFTCRAKAENGSFIASERERREILQAACEAGFTFVDVELTTMREYAIHPRNGEKIILSHHDFSKTPDYWNCTEIIDEMSSYAPDVYKIATTVKSDKDIQTLFKILTNRQAKTFIVAGMGDAGKIVRIMAPFLGSLCTFASGTTGPSAPGQIPITELQELYNLFNKLN